MRKLLNTLFVQTQGAYLHLDHETVVMEVGEEASKQMPLHPLASIVVIGNVMVSPHLIARCSQDGRSLVSLDRRGRFQFRIQGPVSGNVLLRRAQHAALDDPRKALTIAKNITAGKIQNCRQVLLRGARESTEDRETGKLSEAANASADGLLRLKEASTLDEVRGIEGMSASAYFEAFPTLLRSEDSALEFKGRTRRPPRDPINAVLSFLYTLLRFDCSSALEGVGLDPQVGYLHSLRPGRPALALDLMEELRPILADRLTLTLINRRQLARDDFEFRSGGSVFLNEAGRKTVIPAWQNRKQEEVSHRVLKKKVPWGLVPHVQAQLLARYLRGDMEEYMPFLWR